MPKKSKSSKKCGEGCHDHSNDLAANGGCCEVACTGCTPHSPPTATSAADQSAYAQKLYEQLPMLMDLQNKLKQTESVKTKKDDFKFWKTQPVPEIGQVITANKPIEEDKPVGEIRSEPYSLPDSFEWCNVNLSSGAQLDDLYRLLSENYVEDDDHLFRFDYSRDFLKWALMPPGWKPQWHCGIRSKTNHRLFGFIAAIPTTVSLNAVRKPLVEINFLCVHSGLRNKRMAPVLIREITRRVNREGIFQAVYTSGSFIPTPVSSSHYYHRPLHPQKLIECGFSSLRQNMTMQRTKKLYALPDEPSVLGFKPLQQKHVKQAHEKLVAYLAKFKIHQEFSVDEFKHWFLSRENVVNSFVVEDPATGEVTDMCSFYTLPSSVIGNKQHQSLKSAYSFYNFSTKTPWTSLMQCALVAAKNKHFDVFNALDLMDNKDFLTDLKFGIGDGKLQYYLFNWLSPHVNAEEMGIVLQ